MAIELRYFEQSDFPLLIQWSGSPRFLLQWAGPSFQYPLTEEQLESYVEGANCEGSNLLVYKAVHQESKDIIGHISLGAIDHQNGSARIGRVLIGDQRYRGQKLGELMVREMLKIAFDDLKLHRVSLGVFDFNTSALACYEKVGFRQEGLLRDFRKFENEYWNLIEMSILEEEWRGEVAAS